MERLVAKGMAEKMAENKRRPAYAFTPEDLVEKLSRGFKPEEADTFGATEGSLLVQALSRNESVGGHIRELLPTVNPANTLPHVALGIRLAGESFTGDKRFLLLAAARTDVVVAQELQEASRERAVRREEGEGLTLFLLSNDIRHKENQIELISREHPNN